MKGLPKSIIKKYGISKKAWKIFHSKKKVKSRVKVMAKKKMYIKKRRKIDTGLIMSMTGAVAYGGGRQYLSNLLSPLTQRIPLGDIADELTLFTINYFLAKGKIPLLNKLKVFRSIGKAGMLIESARIGEFIADRGLSGKIFSPLQTSTIIVKGIR